MQSIAGDAAQHGLKHPQRIYGVEMTKEKHRLDICASGEIDLQVVPEIASAVKLTDTAQGLKLLREEIRDAIGRRLAIAGGLDFHQFADCPHQLLLLRLEIMQAVIPWDIRFGALRTIFFPTVDFLAGHSSSFLGGAA